MTAPPPPRSKPETRQAAALAARVPEIFIKDAPQGKHGKYVSHDDITQIALALVGPFDYEIVEVVRGYIPEWTSRDGDKHHPEREHGIVAALCRLTVDIDGRATTITETGEANSPNIKSDGENLKTAGSDGLKRCFMRVGLGLELWVEQGQHPSKYYLPASIAKHGTGEVIRVVIAEAEGNGAPDPVADGGK